MPKIVGITYRWYNLQSLPSILLLRQRDEVILQEFDNDSLGAPTGNFTTARKVVYHKPAPRMICDVAFADQPSPDRRLSKDQATATSSIVECL